MAAINTIKYPAQIFPEEPPLHYFNELQSQPEHITADSGHLNLEPVESSDVLNLLRVMEAHGFLLQKHQKSHLQYGISNVTLEHLISREKTLRFGPKSWIRAAVKGAASTYAFVIKKTNFRLIQRYYEIAPVDDETDEEREFRIDAQNSFRRAVLKLEAQWRASYDDFKAHAVEKRRTCAAGTVEDQEWARQFEHYQCLRDRVPPCTLDVSVLLSRGHVLDSVQLALGKLAGDVRSKIWVDRIFTDNALATFLWSSGNIVDVRKLITEQRFKNMWRSYFSVLCDTVWGSVTINEIAYNWATVHCES
ncbi:hypothetical protein DE146DRAFT_649430 [Phaeosphaeria sp. MPI-PUGE-AT-0046c]|nr:hypothetical protein DE146DRAFT_649430 [Phaeosphaeria sp. MPI-PUGE-AT-0046c]